MNQILETIKIRRSVRSYLDRPVSQEILEEIIECGRFAPTALGRQPWHFTVVTDRGLIKEIVGEIKKKVRLMLKLKFLLRPLYPDLADKKFLSIAKERAYSAEDRFFYNAPVLIMVSTLKKSTHGLKDSFLAAQNIMLAAHTLGLGTCVIGFAEAINKSDKILKKLKLPSLHKVQVTLTLGYPKVKLDHLPERRKDNSTFI
ncbi:MAG: nitroreductase family protein [Candidatus Omnitrophica bacterium]|nr:nitroreductase family protein [Candidatus Omnitrophota bacterium]